MKRTAAMRELSTTSWVESVAEQRFISVEVARDAAFFKPCQSENPLCERPIRSDFEHWRTLFSKRRILPPAEMRGISDRALGVSPFRALREEEFE